MTDMNKNQPAKLTDTDLDEVAGGVSYMHFKPNDKYYAWSGSPFTRNGKYLCPRCKRPVHYGAGFRFYCDPCDCSWYYENFLLPDPSSGNWEEISREEYYKNHDGWEV